MDIRATTVVSLHMPEEILEKILAGLRVKSLLRLRCVSKSWLSLIDSKRFIETHLQYSTKNTDSAHHRVLINTGNVTKQCSLRTFLEKPMATDLSPIGLEISAHYISYCNGLLCVYQNKRFLLLNPSTRVSKELPEDPEIEIRSPRVYYPTFGLGWDESSGAYKVFANRKGVGRVYSSKTNSWKTVKELPDLPTRGIKDGKFVGGKLHWLIGDEDIIISFDLKTESFGTIEFPIGMKDEEGCFVQLGVVGAYLCLSEEYYEEPDNVFDVWLMKEYGVRESWQKLPTIHLTQILPYRIDQYYARVLGESTNEDLIVCTFNFLFIYCPRSGVIRQQRDFDCYFKALYVESLVSPVREISSI